MAQARNKTQATDGDVAAFLGAVEHPVRRSDALTLDALFREVTGWAPRMWGESIIGYGTYDYIYESGREGTFLATGFSPRKTRLSVYIMPGYQAYGDLLDRLGKHKHGAACLYINKLTDVDQEVLVEIIRLGLRDLSVKYPVSPT